MQKIFRDGICHLEFAGASFLSQGKLKLCVVQIPAVPKASIVNDLARPHVVQILHHLIRGNGGAPLLTDLAPGGGPVLVVLPELSLGFTDWAAVDDIVNHAGRDLMLIVGFGYTPGNSVQLWAVNQAAEGATLRTLAWDDVTNPISGARPVNGGWCWYRSGAGRTCVTFLKSHLDQTEVPLQVQTSPTLLRIEFGDAILFPLICADVLQTKNQSAASPQARISSDLAAVGGGIKPILLPVLALQDEPYNANWQMALAGAVNSICPGDHRVLVCISNQALGRPNADERIDRWRSLSGLYGRYTDCPKGQVSLQSARPLVVPDIAGAIVRESGGCVVGGAVTWPPYTPTARFQWQAEYCVPIVVDSFGPVTGLYKDAYAFELSRLTHRFPPESGWNPLVSQGYVILREHLLQQAAPSATRIVGSLTSGVEEKSLPSADMLSRTLPPQEALNVLTTLKALPDVAWQASEQLVGQLTLDGTIHVLVWKDPVLSASQMTRKIEAWCLTPGTHPPLLIIAEGNQSSQLNRGLIKIGRRSDFADPPPETGGALIGAIGDAGTDEFTSPRNRRRAAVAELHTVSNFYTDADPETEPARREQCLQILRAMAELTA